MQIKPIGLVNSPFKDKFGTPRQSQIAKSTVSRLVLDKKIAPPEVLEGLEPDHYVWILFWFHLNTSKKPIRKVRPPRLRGRTMGVLATRSPHRPNPIGLSLGKVVLIEKNIITVEGIDLVDQTPILDIKPYIPDYDQPKAKNYTWIEQNPFPKLDVKFADNLFEKVAKKIKDRLQEDLSEILAEDPRPLAYLNRPQHLYWVKYGDHDVGFEIKDNILTVKQLKPLK
jgi:tRNA-Thr(GGU) m(6)t(6)A37 methyltransferase TsaA